MEKQAVKEVRRARRFGIEEAKRVLEEGPRESQIHAARCFVDSGAKIEEIKGMTEHENTGVKLLAIRALQKHKRLPMEERRKWGEAWEKEMLRILKS